MDAPKQNFSKIKEVVSAWQNIRQFLRAGEDGHLVPVVIPRSRRGLGWLYSLSFAVYLLLTALLAGGWFALPFGLLALIVGISALGSWVGSSVVEIEQGTTGIVSRYGKIITTLGPGRHSLWWPWEKVEFVVDTSTEIPYTAPVLACPTRENVPLKSIEFFLKFRIIDPVAFVRNIGASNFDAVLSSAVQDAIRQRSRQVETERAYDLRGSDVNDMQEILNRQMKRYGVQITGANIPDVQLPDQYQQHLATREQIAKELSAYEREWELIRGQRVGTMQMEIERARKVREARLVEVKTALHKAREDVAPTLQRQETEAQKVRWEIEARGRAALKAAENEARGLRYLGQSYKDNWAVLQYELAQRRLQVASKLARHAPRPLLVSSEGGDQSALATLVLARLLPDLLQDVGQTGQVPTSTSQARQRQSKPTDDQLVQGMLNRDIGAETGG